MKLMNYDMRTLILQNLKIHTHQHPTTYSKAQYNILYRLIKQKHITKQFFDYLLFNLYGLHDWKRLNYSQMYELIHIITYYDYKKERYNND